MFITDENFAKRIKKEDLEKINDNLKSDLPALFEGSPLKLSKDDALCFSSYESLIDKNNLENIKSLETPLLALDSDNLYSADCYGLKEKGAKNNIFVIDLDRDGFQIVVYKIEEKNKQDRFFFNTHIYRENIFKGPEIVRRALRIRKRNKIYEFEIKNNKLVFFALLNASSEKKFSQEDIKEFSSDIKKLPTKLIEKKKLCEIKVKNGKYNIYSFFDYQFGEEDMSGFNVYGHLLELDE